MKMQQTDNSVVFETDGKGGLIFGGILAALGVVLLGFQLFGDSALSWSSFVLPAIPLIVGVVLILTAYTEIISITRGDVVNITKKYLARKTESVQEFPTSDVKEVRLETSIKVDRDEKSNTDRRQVTELSLTRDNGPSILIRRHSMKAKRFGLGTAKHAIPLTNEAEVVATILELPVNIVDLRTLKGTMTVVKEAADEVSKTTRNLREQSKR